MRKILIALRPYGVAFKVHGGRYQAAGFPDILFWRGGKCYGLEVKRPGEAYGVTPLQKLTLEQLAAEGVVVGVVHSVPEVFDILHAHDDTVPVWGKTGPPFKFSHADVEILTEDVSAFTGQNKGGST